MTDDVTLLISTIAHGTTFFYQLHSTNVNIVI